MRIRSWRWPLGSCTTSAWFTRSTMRAPPAEATAGAGVGVPIGAGPPPLEQALTRAASARQAATPHLEMRVRAPTSAARTPPRRASVAEGAREAPGHQRAHVDGDVVKAQQQEEERDARA